MIPNFGPTTKMDRVWQRSDRASTSLRDNLLGNQSLGPLTTKSSQMNNSSSTRTTAHHMSGSRLNQPRCLQLLQRCVDGGADETEVFGKARQRERAWDVPRLLHLGAEFGQTEQKSPLRLA